MEWPAPETEGEDWLIAAATLLFVEPRRADRARRALRKALGGNRFEHLMGLLAFIRTAHYWTVLHPELSFEDDVRDLLKVNEELARLLLEDQEAARCDMGIRLFEELTELRELNERHELEKAKRALEEQVQQKELLLKEVNHRVKNSLQIVSSILQLQIPHVASTEAADAMRSAAARVLAIAAVHERLYTGEDATIVRLDTFLSDLCGEIGRAYGCPEMGSRPMSKRVDVPTDMAVPLALIVNELVTNVVKHVGPPCEISLRSEVGDALKLTISDTGQGPPQDQPRLGLGTRIVDAFSTQLGAQVETKRVPGGYSIELTVPTSSYPAVIYAGAHRRGRRDHCHASCIARRGVGSRSVRDCGVSGRSDCSIGPAQTRCGSDGYSPCAGQQRHRCGAGSFTRNRRCGAYS